MSQLLAKGADYTFTKLPESREWFRLLSGTVNTLHDLEIEASLIGNLGPIGKLAKGIDGFFYLKKSIEDVEVVVYKGQRLYQVRDKDTLFELFNATVKFTGDTLAAFKWFAVFGGVAVLSPYAKTFGYVKNACSVWAAFVAIKENVEMVHSNYKSADPDREAKMMEGTALAVISVCSLWLNGVGGLSSYVGIETFIERGLDYPKPWTFNSVIILSNVTSIATNIAKS